MRDYSNDSLVALLPFPAEDAHKYSRGKVIAIVGSKKYPGAAALAARASQRTGAGYTEVITAQEAVSLVQAHYPSLVVSSWKGKPAQFVQMSQFLAPCAYVIGCGFDGEGEKPEKVTYEILEKTNAPVLLDGGALQYIGTGKGQSLCLMRRERGQRTVLTPHGGEAARLADALNVRVEDSKEQAIRLAMALGSTVVLKESDVYISDGEDVCVITQGTAALAKAGTGDVLSGMIGALLAQGLDAFDACVLGTVLHADAGVLAADTFTAISVTAEDIVEGIPAAIINLSER